MIGHRFNHTAALVFWLALAGCATVQTTQPGAVGIERKQTMLVSEDSVERGAAKAYATEVQQAGTSGKLNADPALTGRIRHITERLIPVTATFRPDAPGWKWEVNTLTTPEMNAYAMPGGKIMVYSGLVETLQLSDAEIAAVLGHEISHALREHTRERVSRAYEQQVGLVGLAVLTGIDSSPGPRRRRYLSDLSVAAQPRTGSRGGCDGSRADGPCGVRPPRGHHSLEKDDGGGKERAAAVPEHAPRLGQSHCGTRAPYSAGPAVVSGGCRHGFRQPVTTQLSSRSFPPLRA